MAILESLTLTLTPPTPSCDPNPDTVIHISPDFESNFGFGKTVVNNYTNRSSKDVDNVALAKAYGLAVTASCGIALAAGKAMASAPPSVKMLGPFVPYLAVITAGNEFCCTCRLCSSVFNPPTLFTRHQKVRPMSASLAWMKSKMASL